MWEIQVKTALLWAALCAQVHGQVKVLAPSALVSQFKDSHGTVYGTTATFGAPYYGERVLGQLVYGETKGRDHCTGDDYDMAPPPPSKSGQKLVNVLLVRRGGCTFVNKVAVGQEKGAHAVIIVDKESSDMDSEQVQKIVMADDGFGFKVKIPSILVSKVEGRKLIEAVRRAGMDGPVVVELAWDIPRGAVVVADFWMSSGSRESSEFLERFQDSAETLKYHLQFVPHFHIFSLPPAAGFNHLCASSIDSCDECRPTLAKYCAPDPDGPGPVTGGHVANEDLRRLCIWNVTAKKQQENGAQYSQGFWDYAVQFSKDCNIGGKSADSRFGYECSRKVMDKVDVPEDLVQKCVAQNYEAFLDEQIKEVAWSPQALRLNGWRYSGPLDPETVLTAVCSGYAKPPQECEQLQATYSSNYVHWSTSGAFSWMFTMMAAVVAMLACAFFFYRRHMTRSVRKVLREEVMLEVQTQMADYVEMSDNDKPSNRPALSF